MIWLYVLALAAAVAAAYDYYSAGFRYSFSVGISEAGAEIRVLYPLVRITVEWPRDLPEARVYILKIGGYRLLLSPGGEGKRRINVIRLLRSITYSGLSARAAYAMENPFLTGAAFAALNLAGAFLRPADIFLAPDFASAGPYCDIRAHVNVSLSHTILNYISRRPAAWNRT